MGFDGAHVEYVLESASASFDRHVAFGSGRGASASGFRRHSVFDAEIRPTAVVGTALINDGTERERRKQKLEQRTNELERQNEQLEEFANIVSHDLRNPLSVAQGYLEHAADAGDEDALDDVERSLSRMEAIVEDVLTLARQGRSIGDTESVDLESIVREAWEYVETDRTTLVVEAAGPLEVDPDRLLQLFENCFRNAVQHAGPAVTVTVGRDGDEFYVADDGPGIPDGEREAVLESGYTTAETGTEFGLAIVGRIADAHGWTITITESSTGGARVEFRGVDESVAVDVR